MPLQLEAIDDFVAATLPKFKRIKWTDIAQEFPSYIAPKLIKERGVMEDGGRSIDFRVQTRNSGTFRMTGLYDTDQTGVQDLLISASLPWRFATVNWSYDIREPMFQSERETIIRLLQVREHAARTDMIAGLEAQLWSSPTSSTDELNMMGIPFWLQKDATTTVGGAFNGGNPSGWTGGAAGIDSTVYDGWRNWTFGYSAITTDDLIKKVKKAMVFTDFEAADPFPEQKYGNMSRCIYTTYAVVEALERLAETRNENLGTDVARYMNQVTIAGVPVKTSFYLNANDTSDPLYGVDFGVFRPFIQKGLNMYRQSVKAARQRMVRDVHLDLGMNFACVNRRRCFVGSTS
jgi:hypothetical protein